MSNNLEDEVMLGGSFPSDNFSVYSQTIYEDAEDGSTIGWNGYGVGESIKHR